MLRYEREKELIKKRDETKAELKALLKKYISTRQQRGEEIDDITGKGNICSQTVALAQLEMDGMHTKLDRAVYDINHLGEDCNLSHYSLILYSQPDPWRGSRYERLHCSRSL